jgi:hypothetical protein
VSERRTGLQVGPVRLFSLFCNPKIFLRKGLHTEPKSVYFDHRFHELSSVPITKPRRENDHEKKFGKLVRNLTPPDYYMSGKNSRIHVGAKDLIFDNTLVG